MNENEYQGSNPQIAKRTSHTDDAIQRLEALIKRAEETAQRAAARLEEYMEPSEPAIQEAVSTKNIVSGTERPPFFNCLRARFDSINDVLTRLNSYLDRLG